MTYAVSWRQSPDKWELWVRDRPRLRGVGADLDTAWQELVQAITDATGDCEPVLNFDPPLPGPVSDQEYLSDGLMSFIGSGYTDLEISGREEHYAGGRCEHCRYARGARTDGEIQLRSSMDEDVSHPSGTWSRFAHPILVSERFLSLLRPEERACIEWRPCIPKPGGRKRVFEAIPRHFVPQVAPRRVAIVAAWYCPLCARRMFWPDRDATGIWAFIERSRLPTPLPPLFAAGDPQSYRLVARAGRVLEWLGCKEAKGMDAAPLGVLDPGDVDPTPNLRERERSR